MTPDNADPADAKPEDEVLEPEEVAFDAAETAFMQNEIEEAEADKKL